MVRAPQRKRPAHAESWLMLAGVEAARGETGPAADLARHATSLDPERPDLRRAAEAYLEDGRGSP